MTQNRRIVLNVVATYGRSVYALALGLFTARWALLSLGEVAYGLIGVIAGLGALIKFINSLLSSAVSRFYAYSVGEARVSHNHDEALEECRIWFNSALQIHLVVTTVSLAVGYPIGEWAVRNFLTIPADKVADSIWVFRLTCLSCAVAMLSVPSNAMYTAKQEIAELTIYGFATSTCNAIFLWYIVSHPGDWYLTYAVWITLVAVVPSLLIAIRSFMKYPECRLCFGYWGRWRYIKEMIVYAGYNFLSTLAALSAFQGVAILVNKMMGPASNAAMTIGQSVQNHAMTLSSAFRTAFTPAITNATGANDSTRAKLLARKASIYSSLAVAAFAIPLCIEMDEVMVLWLKVPPAQSGNMARLLLLAGFIDLMSIGQTLAVLSLKEIRAIQVFQALAFSLPIVFSFFAISCGMGLEGVGLGFVVMFSVNNAGKLYYAQKQCGITIRSWFMTVFIPVMKVAISTTIVGVIPSLTLPQSFCRVLLTVVFSAATMLPMIWLIALDQTERNALKRRLQNICTRWYE